MVICQKMLIWDCDIGDMDWHTSNVMLCCTETVINNALLLLPEGGAKRLPAGIVFTYDRFWGFLHAGATKCTDQGEI